MRVYIGGPIHTQYLRQSVRKEAFSAPVLVGE